MTTSLPILVACKELLLPEADDIRGHGVAYPVAAGARGAGRAAWSRVVVTAAGLIHDYGPNSTGGLNINDTEGSVLFTLGGKEHCMRTSASMIWEDKTLNFYAFGWGLRAVRRYRDGDELIWEYVDGSVTRMERLCKLPEENKVPEPLADGSSCFVVPALTQNLLMLQEMQMPGKCGSTELIITILSRRGRPANAR